MTADLKASPVSFLAGVTLRCFPVEPLIWMTVARQARATRKNARFLLMFKSHQRVSNYVLAVFHGTHSHRTQCGTTSIQTGLCLSLAVGISERYKAGNGSRNKENWLLLKLTSGSFFFCIFRELSSGLSDGRWWRHRAGHAKGAGRRKQTWELSINLTRWSQVKYFTERQVADAI